MLGTVTSRKNVGGSIERSIVGPGPASLGWSPGSAPSALDGRLSPQSTAISPLAPPFVGWAPGLGSLALDGRLSPQSTAMSPGSLGGGQRREATLRRRGFTFCRYPCFPGLALGFVGRP